MARRVKPALFTAIIAVLLLHFETGLQHYFLSSYFLETLFNCIHKIARIIKRKHIQSACLVTFLNVAHFFFSSSEFFRAKFKSETASNRRYVNKHLQKMLAQQQIDNSDNIASPAGVSRGARISSLLKEILACEQQTYFRSSLLSLCKFVKTQPVSHLVRV